jgi:hypothetical protein
MRAPKKLFRSLSHSPQEKNKKIKRRKKLQGMKKEGDKK